MQQYQNILFVDIETVPLVKSYTDLAKGLQKEWERKAKFISRGGEEEPDTLFENRAGVFAEFAKIVCISFGSLYQQEDVWKLRLKSIINHDERQLLQEFSEMITRFVAYNQQLVFCGHNIKEFDIPFISRRMLINSMQIPTVMNMSGKKPWENLHIDTLELWKFGDYKNYTSLSLLAEIFGIPSPKDDIDGSMVASVYYNDNDLPRIAKYCTQDVITCAKVFFRLKGEDVTFETEIVEG